MCPLRGCYRACPCALTQAPSRLLTASDLKIGPAPELALVSVDFLLFGDTAARPFGVSEQQELASKLPLTRLRYSQFPATVSLSVLPIEVRTDAISPTGAVGTQTAMLATSSPRCTTADKAAAACLPWSGFSLISSIRLLTLALQTANGMEGVSHWYGAASRNLGGGLGGGSTGAGDNYNLVFNHELGHAFDMPHWGDSLYTRVASTATQSHPYTGGFNSAGSPVGGGFGNSWAYDPLLGKQGFINPVCGSGPGIGLERQEPMQRNGKDCLVAGQTFDHFSDYSGLFIHRYFTGASISLAGTVTSPRDTAGNTSPRYALPSKSGRPHIVTSASGQTNLQQWSTSTQAYIERSAAVVDSDLRVYGERYPVQWNVPVITLWGAFSSSSPTATTILHPLQYQGNLKRNWDPTNTADFAAMKAFVSGDAFWWGADLVAKAEFSNGSVRHVLVKRYARGTNTLNSDTHTYWAVNIPALAGATLSKVSLYHRPMEVRYSDNGNTSSSYYVSTNLNSTLNTGLTPAQYLNTASLVAVRSF
jgi:Peptidase M66